MIKDQILVEKDDILLYKIFLWKEVGHSKRERMKKIDLHLNRVFAEWFC